MGIKQFKLIAFFVFGSMASWIGSGVLAQAQPGGYYPTYYRVDNVASYDVLNARADSNSASPIIGSLAYDEPLVEVLRQEHNWGYVALGEQMGWVSMSFLRQIEVPKVGQSALPVDLSCGGTEPFWGFHLGQTQVHYSHMDGGDLTFNISTAKGFSGFAGQDGFVQASGSQSMFTAIFSTQQCSDGMSDIDYGWRVDVVLTGENGAEGFSGCCRLVAAP